MVGMAAWRDGKKIEQSNSPAACEKVESVQKKSRFTPLLCNAPIIFPTILQIIFEFSFAQPFVFLALNSKNNL